MELKEEVEQLKDKNKNYHQMEETMQSAIVVAQRAADELKQKAAREADAVKNEAEREARQIIDNAKNRSARILIEHESMVKQAKTFKERFRSFIEGQLTAIDNEELFDEPLDESVDEPFEETVNKGNVLEFEPAVKYEPEPEEEIKEQPRADEEEEFEPEPDLNDDIDLDYGLERDLDKDPNF
jgi:cell division initiation protein